MLDFNALKEKYSCVDVAQQLGIELRSIGGGEYRGTSLAPGEHSHNDGLAVNAEVWHDFTAGVGGSVLDLVSFVKFGDTEHLREAAQFLAGDEYDARYWQEYTSQRNTLNANIQAWHKALLADERTLEYLHSRKITAATIERFMLGLCDEYLKLNDGSLVHELRLMIPYYDANDRPFYYASRQLAWAAHEGSPKYHKAKQSEFLRNGIFGLNTIPRNAKDCDTVVITEGAVDALTIAQAGYPIQSPICGSFGRDREPVVIKNCRKFRRVITAFDIDENGSGQGFTCHMGKLFLNAGIVFYAVEGYGEGCKDVSEYYCADGSIDALLDGAINGYKFMSRYTFWEQRPVLLSKNIPFHGLSADDRAKYLGEIKQLVFKLKNLLEPLEFDDILVALCEYYPRDKIAKFAEGPTANEVLCDMRDQFLDGRKLFFCGSTQHGEYWQYSFTHGYWYTMTDADLQAEIAAFFGHELDNRTVENLVKKVRLMNTKKVMPEFNKARVQVFTNGTLELDTGLLREHRHEDFMTWAHTFAYDATATCPEYDAFLDAVADGQPSRVEWLDDLAAYVLYEDCRFEKAFFLIGEGANGKGVYLKTIEALFSSSNTRANSQSVTNVQPCDFEKPTERIALEASILNIGHDIKPNLKDAESYIKSISSGDTITGNHKFYDSHSFSPRAKLVCSSNHMIKVCDDSFGMRRRLTFCKFEVRFEDKADTTLGQRLKAELSGIFNRVYRAYQALREREKTLGKRALRESCDQAAYLAEFTETTNPVATFWHEHSEALLARCEVKKSEIFDLYRTFCERNSLYAGRENAFHGSLQRVLQDEGVTCHIEQRREGNARPRYYILLKLKTLEDFIDPDGEGDGLPD